MAQQVSNRPSWCEESWEGWGEQSHLPGPHKAEAGCSEHLPPDWALIDAQKAPVTGRCPGGNAQMRSQ